MFLKNSFPLLLCLINIFCFSCSSDYEVSTTYHQRTLLAYLAGDHNLTNEVSQKAAALLEGWDPNLGQLLIFADSQDSPSAYLLRARKTNGLSMFDTLRHYNQHNSASPALLATAITDLKHFAPASSYGLLLFSHASGWLPQGALENPTTWRIHPKRNNRNRASSTHSLQQRSKNLVDSSAAEHNNITFSPTEEKLTYFSKKKNPILGIRTIFQDNDVEMELNDFQQAIPDSLFQFIAFDMCFMSGVEVVYALRHKAQYLLASTAEILSPGFTPIYPTHLHLLYKKQPDLKGFAEAYYDHYSHLSGIWASATISVVHTAAIEELRHLTLKIQNYKSNSQNVQTGYNNQFTAYPYFNIQYFDRGKKPKLFYDLGNYLMALTPSPSTQDSVQKVLSKTVLFERHTPSMINLPLRSHCGLSIYLPHPALPHLNSAYQQTSWMKDSVSQ